LPALRQIEIGNYNALRRVVGFGPLDEDFEGMFDFNIAVDLIMNSKSLEIFIERPKQQPCVNAL